MNLSDQHTADGGVSAPAVTGTRPRTPVTQTVLRRIQAMLRSGELAPGQPLPSQRQLAEDLQVSRASLREALSILGTLGLIRIEQGRGTFAAASADSIDGEVPGSWRYGARYTPAEVYQLRLIAEPSAAALAARYVTHERLEQLERNLRAFKASAREMDLVSTAQLDFEFHKLIAVCSGNRLLADLHQTYHEVVLDSQRLPLARRSHLWAPVVEHERILKALSMHDPEGAAYYMRVHISRAADRVGAEVVDAGG
jgi:GntR family transcriptional regulator, transcriptional repressor for pyruvate dehydrogenase complex